MRLEINRKTHLAVEAIGVLDDLHSRVQGAPLANAIGTSPAFLAQVMAPLVRNGWVDSVTGRAGGYALAVDPESISLLALIEAVEGPTDDGCALRGGECSSVDSCAIHDAWIRAKDLMVAELSTQPITTVPRQGVLE
ncbi:MAG TPA: Rrf2 family transcriptional regulator [Acidimicrobiia bacterium]|jgi:Rrf2 family protein|nr:Rrf2 family transcriptional regulator [Acidimicrobiia bacterium]